MDNDVNTNEKTRTDNLFILSGFCYGPQDIDTLEETRVSGVKIIVTGPQDALLVSDSNGNFSTDLLREGKYKLSFSDPSGKYFRSAYFVNLIRNIKVPIDMAILGDKIQEERKKHRGAGIPNTIHGFVHDGKLKPLSGISVWTKSVILDSQKLGKVGRVFSAFSKLIKRNKNEEDKQKPVIPDLTNMIGRFSTKRLPSGSYIVSFVDPSDRYIFFSKVVILKNKPIAPLDVKGFAKEDIEELQKKNEERQLKAEEEKAKKQEQESRQKKAFEERMQGKTQRQGAAKEDASGVITSKGEFIEMDKDKLLSKTQMSRQSKETFSNPTRMPFRNAAERFTSFGEKGAGFAQKATSGFERAAGNAAKSGIKGAGQGLRGTLQTARAVLTVARTIAPLVANPVGAIVIGVVIVLILIFFFLKPSIPGFSGGGGTGGETGTGGTGSGGSNCSSGSLDYHIPFKDSAVSPLDPASVKEQILARWPQAQLQYWDKIIGEAVINGWNPAFVLALWIEETGASHHTKTENGGGGGTPVSKGHLGCAPWEDQTIDESLSCLFRAFNSYDNFEDLMCVYGGDKFSKAPCTFNTQNPNFPPNIKDWYSKLVPEGTGAITPSKTCLAQGSGWPTTGILTQGPLGAYDHARLARDIPEEALDIADPSGPPVFSTFDGVATVHDCIADGDCARGWGGYGNSVEIVSNNGAFRAIYGHLSSFTISNGQEVKAGDQLGFMGTTGVSTGIHLHWGFRGIKMEKPNIPENIAPPDCDPPAISCTPASISRGDPGI